MRVANESTGVKVISIYPAIPQAPAVTLCFEPKVMVGRFAEAKIIVVPPSAAVSRRSEELKTAARQTPPPRGPGEPPGQGQRIRPGGI